MNKIYLAFAALLLFSCTASKHIPTLETFQDIEYRYETHKIELSDDLTLAYVEEGEGDQVVISIHGLGSYLPAWDKNIGDLSDKYRMIAIDLPGYGKSSKGNYEYSMTYYAAVVKEFAEAKGFKKINIAGHSMGGQIALVTALQYPELVDKLILVAPAGFEVFNKGEREWFRNVMTVDGVKLTTVEQIRSNLSYNFYRMPADAEFMFTDRVAMRKAADFDAYCYAVAQSVRGMVDQPVYDFLPEIKHETLVLFGENDNLIPNRFLNGGKTEKYAKDGSSRMPNAKLVMLPKTGHFAQYEQAERVNEEIRAFLK